MKELLLRSNKVKSLTINGEKNNKFKFTVT